MPIWDTLWLLYPLVRSTTVSTMHEHSITTFDLCPEPCQPRYPPHPHPLQALEKCGEHYYPYSLTHFTVLLWIQLLSMIYWYHKLILFELQSYFFANAFSQFRSSCQGYQLSVPETNNTSPSDDIVSSTVTPLDLCSRTSLCSHYFMMHLTRREWIQNSVVDRIKYLFLGWELKTYLYVEFQDWKANQSD